MLHPEQLLAIIRARPEILPLLSEQTKAYALGDDAYYKMIERDPKEPGYKQKMKYEKKMAALMKRIFDRQKEQLTPILTTAFYVKAVPDINWTDDEEADMSALLIEVYGKGIDLFRQEVFEGLPDDFVNHAAQKLAKEYAYDGIRVLQKQVDETTRKAIQDAIASFTEPGVTLTDVIDKLPFGEDRATRVAVTEITRAYASASQAAGEEMQKQFPDLTIIKTWYTNVDDRVCDICGPLHMKSVKIDEEWDGIDQPPAHVNCRCWTDYGSTLAGNVDMYAPITETPSGQPQTVLEGMLTNIADTISENKFVGFMKDGYENAINAINKIHSLPETFKNKLSVFSSDTSGRGGAFYPLSNRIELTSRTRNMNQAALTFAHEYGHFIDGNLLLKNPQLRADLISNIRKNSKTMFGGLVKFKNPYPRTYLSESGESIEIIANPISTKFISYLKNDAELIARSYAQYVAEKTDNAEMNEAMKNEKIWNGRTLSDIDSWRQWPKDEFKPIKDAWDNTFDVLGMKR